MKVMTEYMREWRLKNKEHIREYIKKYKLENREHVLAVQRVLNHKNYYANHVPKVPKPKLEPEPKPSPKLEPEQEVEIKIERGTFKISF
jgi:hypothetical protein